MASRTPLRQLLDDHVSRMLTQADEICEERLRAERTAAGDAARRETAERLNQAVRLLQQAESAETFWAALADGCLGFASGLAVFGIEVEELTPLAIRGVSGSVQQAFSSLRVPLAGGAALKAAITSSEPVVAAATPSEVSQELLSLLAHPAEQRMSVFPVMAGGSAKALVCAWGTVERAAIELLCYAAGAGFARFAVQPAAELVTITPAAANASPKWDDLSAVEQRTHLRAQRFARVQVASIRLQKAPAVQAGRARGDIYEELQPALDAAREEFKAKFFSACPSMVDYLHLEILRTLANEDAELLGRNYPGPLV
jgi:hypothetical protein